MSDHVINIELNTDEKPEDRKKEIRNRFIIQLISTLAIIGFCTYSLISDGKLPDKDSLIYALLGGVFGTYLPQPKMFH